jgi:hypothetical protein
MFEAFHQSLQRSEPDERWGKMTLQTQEVLDQVYQAAGCSL